MSTIYKNGTYYGQAGDPMPSTDMEEVLSPLPSVMSRRMKYSTDEQIVGEWIDGKPIYQKTLKIDNPGNDWNNTVKTYTSLGIDNPDLVWKVGSAILDIGSDHRQYTEHSYGTASYFTVLASSGNNGLLFKWTTSGTSNFIIITLQYTKTTD